MIALLVSSTSSCNISIAGKCKKKYIGLMVLFTEKVG
jgi:hypothetical protein